MAFSPLAVIGTVLAAGYFLIWLFCTTDTAKIKNLPEIPGVPVFGNLLQLGTNHARVAGVWAKKVGPVFQARLGNRVSADVSVLRPLAVAARASDD